MNSGDSYKDTQSAWTFRKFPAPYNYKWGLYPHPLFPDVAEEEEEGREIEIKDNEGRGASIE